MGRGTSSSGRGGSSGSGVSDSGKAALMNAWGTTSVARYAQEKWPTREAQAPFYGILNRARNGFGKLVTPDMVRAAARHIQKAWKPIASRYSGTDDFGNKYSPGDQIYWDRNGGTFRKDAIDKLSG